MWKQTGRKPAALQLKKPDPEVWYLWEWYCSARRNVRLTYQELESWARLMKVQLSILEVELLMAIDAVVSKELESV